MFTKERHQALLRLLAEKQRLTNDELQAALGVSSATLRRDLADLEAGHHLVRFHGGAAHPAYLQGEPTFEEKSLAAQREKRAMAALAAALVPPRATVFLDAGTSCLEVGRALMTRRDLTLIANSIALPHAARDAEARIICLGGELRRVSGALVGSLALAWLSQLNADVCFIGASGLAKDGPSTTELFEAEVKQALMERAKRRVLVADASKWDAPATVRFARWPDFHDWVTSASLPRGVEAALGCRSLRISRAATEARRKRPGAST